MRHLNSFLARGGAGDLNKNFPKIQVAGGRGMLKLRFDWYIRSRMSEFNALLLCVYK